MKKKATLLLFTVSFPYGNKSETYLESEIKILSQEFDAVYIIPAQKDSDQIRPVPHNVVVANIITERQKRKGVQILCANFSRVLSVYLFSLLYSKSNFVYYSKCVRYYFPKLIGELEYMEAIGDFIDKNELKEAVFYTYWFEYFLTGLSILKKEGKIKHLYSRAHRFDLYDEINHHLPVSFRDFKMKYVDEVFCISRHGQHYLQSKTEAKWRHKVNISYLGVHPPAAHNDPPQLDVPLVVSTSNMVPFKRVDLIAMALKNCTMPIRWVHFGNGTEYEKILSICNELPANISWTLAGHVTNSDVLNFYEENYVNLFINLSESEGLPVSMMEVISFGIPIIACSVCGIPEIVINEKTGFLLDVNETETTISKKIEDALRFDFDRKAIVSFFNENFEANQNYLSFTKAISP